MTEAASETGEPETGEIVGRMRRLDELYDRLAEKLRSLELQAGEERGTAGTWSVKDVYAHIARWDELSRGELGEHIAGRTPPEEQDYRLLNAEWLAEDALLPLPEARRRFEECFAEYRAFLGSLHENQYDETIRDHVDTAIEHYEDHLRDPLEFEVAPGG